MKTIALYMFMCAQTTGQCLQPIQVAVLSNYYDCMVRGYSESIRKTNEIGKEEINKHKIYMKFMCREIITKES